MTPGPQETTNGDKQIKKDGYHHWLKIRTLLQGHDHPGAFDLVAQRKV